MFDTITNWRIEKHGNGHYIIGECNGNGVNFLLSYIDFGWMQCEVLSNGFSTTKYLLSKQGR